MTAKLLLLVLVSLASSVAIQAAVAATSEDNPKHRYPPTRATTVVETIHGVEIADPYRWLETNDSAEVHSWIEAQNQFTRDALDKLPGRETIRQRLSELLSVGSISAPAVRGHLYYYSKREGRQNQPIVYVRDGLRGEPHQK